MKPVRIIPINVLYTLDFELTSIFAQRQIWVDGVLFKKETPRNQSALIYLNGCTGTYTDLITSESFFAPCKSLVYLPYGGRYTVLNIQSKIHEPDAYLVEFNMLQNDECFALARKPFLITTANPYYMEKSMRETVDCYESIPHSPALLKSRIFEMLTQISKDDNTFKKQIYATISPALEYMNKFPYDTVSVEHYAKMCGLSSGGFRRLFKQYMGKSPRDYVIDAKITSAKTLLEESELSVKEISEFLNFESTSYFCRLFKKRILVSPSQFRDSKKNQIL